MVYLDRLDASSSMESKIEIHGAVLCMLVSRKLRWPGAAVPVCAFPERIALAVCAFDAAQK
jgi:hypothetical protein